MTRREILRAGALGTLGLSLPQLLRAESASRNSRIKSCVMVFALLRRFFPIPYCRMLHSDLTASAIFSAVISTIK